jgi:cytochrome c oxidase subunit 2
MRKTMMVFVKALKLLAVTTASLLAAVSAASAAQPTDWGIGLQEAATGIMEQLIWFNAYTLIIITVIVAFVTALLAYVVVRYRRSANPVPSKTSHNTLIEVIWTVVPVLILVAIAIPSMRLLYAEAVVPESDMTVKAIGYQWYWGYEYPDHGDIAFEAIMLNDEARAERAQAQGVDISEVPRLLATDNEMVVPVNTTVRVQITSADVLHAFAIPAFGVKMDAVPGRLNETWFHAEKEGVYYGQCSQLCGKDHAFMPIQLRVVSQEQFDAWAELAATDLQAANDQLAASIRESEKKYAQR